MTSIVLILFFFGAMIAIAHELACRLFARRTDISMIERAAYTGVLATASWLAIAWALAFAHRLTRTNLLLCAAIVLLLAIVSFLRRKHVARISFNAQHAMTLLFLAPVIAYTIFLLWKGAVMPPSAPDGITYHLPRAAMIMQSGTVEPFDVPDIRVNRLPPNYEVMLATMMLLEQSDQHTEWLSTLYFLYFLIVSAAVARQWFGAGIHVVAVALIVATMPVLLLQGTLHKNDAMVSGLLVASLLALARWLNDASPASAFLLGLSTLCAIGTKSQGLVVASLAFVVFVVAFIRYVRAERVSLVRMTAVVLILLMLLPLLGAYGYVIAQRSVPASAQAIDRVAPVEYGEWSHLWVVPSLILVAPFLTNAESILVPWNGERWLWGNYDPFASHFGVLFTFIAIAFPFCMWKFRRDPGEVAPSTRLIITAIALLAALAMLAVHAPIYGYVSGFPRYVMFAVPFIATWAAAPLFTRLARMRQRSIDWLMVLLMLIVIHSAISVAVNDKFSPLTDVRTAALHPGTRWVASMPMRAASVVDRMAAQDAVIDIYGGLDTWTYPAFGASLKRKVRFIHDISEIHPDAEWVIVDRAYNVVWGDPNFRHMRDYPRYLSMGRPTEEDLKLLRQLSRDRSQFAFVTAESRTVQAVFHRRGAKNDRDILRK